MKLDDFTRAILTNPEVLAVNQDPLGKAAARVGGDEPGFYEDIWARPLEDGSIAVGIVNLSYETRTTVVDLRGLGLVGGWNVPWAEAGMVIALAGSGLDVSLKSWSNPASQTLPLVPDTFSLRVNVYVSANEDCERKGLPVLVESPSKGLDDGHATDREVLQGHGRRLCRALHAVRRGGAGES